MSATAQTLLTTHRDAILRWVLCFALVIAIHVGGAMALLARWNSDDLLANPPSITIELAPIAASPEIVPADMPIGPQQVEAEPEPQPEKVEPPPPEAQVAIEPPKPPEKPKEKEKPKKERVAKLTSAPAPAQQRSDIASAPNSGAAAASPAIS